MGKTSTLNNALVWFGAGVSIAEILTGTYFAPLGLSRGVAAIIIGHIIGCALLFFAALISARRGTSAMETTQISFGYVGGRLFALLNVMQLVGWTGIMIYDGAVSAVAMLSCATTLGGIRMLLPLAAPVWALIIGALIVVWIIAGVTNMVRVNAVAMTALFALTIVLCVKLFGGWGNVPQAPVGVVEQSPTDALSFGAAVELSVAMPLSWLPLIGDYTMNTEKPVRGSLVSAVVYALVSCWMYIIGMGSAIFTGTSDIAQIMLRAGLGICGVLVIVLSTVTTTFLDAFSAGISAVTLRRTLNGKVCAVTAAVLGTIGAVVFNMDNITDFLYLIGSVFAPMAAILIADFFVLKSDSSASRFDVTALAVWAAGFVLYRLTMRLDLVTGVTLPVMAATFACAVLVGKVRQAAGKQGLPTCHS